VRTVGLVASVPSSGWFEPEPVFSLARCLATPGLTRMCVGSPPWSWTAAMASAITSKSARLSGVEPVTSVTSVRLVMPFGAGAGR